MVVYTYIYTLRALVPVVSVKTRLTILGALGVFSLVGWKEGPKGGRLYPKKEEKKRYPCVVSVKAGYSIYIYHTKYTVHKYIHTCPVSTAEKNREPSKIEHPPEAGLTAWVSVGWMSSPSSVRRGFSRYWDGVSRAGGKKHQPHKKKHTHTLLPYYCIQLLIMPYLPYLFQWCRR